MVHEHLKRMYFLTFLNVVSCRWWLSLSGLLFLFVYLSLFKHFFNWRIISILCWLLTYINMNILPTSHPIPPPRLSQSTRFDFLASYSKFPLAICFTDNNVYFSAIISNPTPPSFPYCVQKSLLNGCISFAALQICSSVLSF